MFDIDPSMILLDFVVCPVIALLCFLNLTASNYDTLPYQRSLMKLPGYAFLYRRSEGDSDIPDRSLKKTLTWLGILYLSVLALLAPFANKLLGMLDWLLSEPPSQVLLVLFFNLSIIVTCYSLFAFLKGLRAQSTKRYHFLPLLGLGLLLVVVAIFSMSSKVQLVVLLACKTTLLGLFGFFFFGALLFSLNETESNSAAAEVGSGFVNIFLVLLSVGSLMSIVV